MVRNTKKFNNRIMIITGLAMIFFFFFFKFRKPIEEKRTVAVVGDLRIGYSKFSEFIGVSPSSVTMSEKKLALDFMVNQEIIKIYAEKADLIKGDIAESINKQRLDAYDELLAQMFIDTEMKENSNVSEREVKEYFALQDYITIKFIAISYNDENAMEKIQLARAQLEKNVSFDEVLNQYTDKIFLKHDGIMGFYTDEDIKGLAPSYRLSVEQLKEAGDFSEIFQESYGYFLLYRDKTPVIEDVYSKIEEILINQKQQKVIEKIYSENKAKFEIENTEKIITFDSEDIEVNSELEIVKFDHDLMPIRLSEFHNKIKDFYSVNDFSGFEEQELSKIAENIGLAKLLVKSAYRKKINEDEEFLRKWKSRQSDLKKAEGEKIVDYVLSQNPVNIEETQIRNYYENHKDDFKTPSHYKLQKIVLPTMSEAKNTYKKVIDENLDFTKAVLDFSTAYNVSENKGFTAYLSYEDLGDLYKIIIQKQPGDILEPVEFEDEFTIFKVIEEIEGADQDYNSVKDMIYTRLMIDSMDGWIQGIIKTYNIKVVKYYDNL